MPLTAASAARYLIRSAVSRAANSTVGVLRLASATFARCSAKSNARARISLRPLVSPDPIPSSVECLCMRHSPSDVSNLVHQPDSGWVRHRAGMRCNSDVKLGQLHRQLEDVEWIMLGIMQGDP